MTMALYCASSRDFCPCMEQLNLTILVDSPYLSDQYEDVPEADSLHKLSILEQMKCVVHVQGQTILENIRFFWVEDPLSYHSAGNLYKEKLGALLTKGYFHVGVTT